MHKKAIVNGNIVTPCVIIPNGAVLIVDGLIAACGPMSSIILPEDATIIDAGGHYVMPGFIDIHCHGGGGVWAWEDPERFAASHLKFGTTGILPTMLYSLNKAETFAGVQRILQAERTMSRRLILGIHMEGPFINRKYGPPSIRPVDPDEYNALLQLAGDRIKLWTLAPELAGQRKFAEAAFAYDIALSVGHSEATAETIFSYVPYGLKVGCHCTNASGVTPSPSAYAGTREVGVDEAVLVHDDIYAEIIPDAGGLHVRPLMCKLIHKTKGTNRVIIISDAMDETGATPSCAASAIGEAPPQANLDADVNFVPGIGLFGSRLTMNQAVRNMMRHAGVGFVEASIMASLNPARLLKIDHVVGSVEQGKQANLLIVSENIDIKTVIFQGNVVL